MNTVATIRLTIAAGETASEPFHLAVVSIVALQSRGLLPYVQRISLPDTWHAATLGYEVSTDGEQWAPLTDLRGPISCAARPGQVLNSEPGIWRDVAWLRLRSEPAQPDDVSVVVDVSAYETGVQQWRR